MLNSTIVQALASPPANVASSFSRLIHVETGLLNTKDMTLAGLLVVLMSVIVYASFGRRLAAGKVVSPDTVPFLRGMPIFGHWRFFSDRYAFVNEGMRKSGSAFQFNILNVGKYLSFLVTILRCHS